MDLTLQNLAKAIAESNLAPEPCSKVLIRFSVDSHTALLLGTKIDGWNLTLAMPPGTKPSESAKQTLEACLEKVPQEITPALACEFAQLLPDSGAVVSEMSFGDGDYEVHVVKDKEGVTIEATSSYLPKHAFVSLDIDPDKPVEDIISEVQANLQILNRAAKKHRQKQTVPASMEDALKSVLSAKTLELIPDSDTEIVFRGDKGVFVLQGSVSRKSWIEIPVTYLRFGLGSLTSIPKTGLAQTTYLGLSSVVELLNSGSLFNEHLTRLGLSCRSISVAHPKASIVMDYIVMPKSIYQELGVEVRVGNVLYVFGEKIDFQHAVNYILSHELEGREVSDDHNTPA